MNSEPMNAERSYSAFVLRDKTNQMKKPYTFIPEIWRLIMEYRIDPHYCLLRPGMRFYNNYDSQRKSGEIVHIQKLMEVIEMPTDIHPVMWRLMKMVPSQQLRVKTINIYDSRRGYVRKSIAIHLMAKKMLTKRLREEPNMVYVTNDKVIS